MVEFITKFNDGAYILIKDNNDKEGEKEYNVDFKDIDTGIIEYHVDLKSNYWAKTNIKYYINWLITIKYENKIIYEKKIDLRESSVFINFDSKSLGDTISWVPFVEIFRKKHNIDKIYCSTFHNNLFRNIYPNIIFYEPNYRKMDDFMYCYNIGIFGDGKNKYKNKINPFKIPLQQTICDILGLEYVEDIHSPIYYKKSVNKIKQKYVCIAEHSTAQCKYWNNPNGWQNIVNYLKENGYLIYSLSKEDSNYRNNKPLDGIIKLNDKSLKSAINLLEHCEFFIGLSSGLSWLSWAMKKKTIMISGFSEPWYEFSSGCIRIHNDNVCNGCFNKPDTFIGFNRSDWLWCPMYKGTDKHFECSKNITSDEVIKNIKMLENDEYDFIEYNDLMNRDIYVPLSMGEIVDKVTILDIKKDRIKDVNKLKNIENEYNSLIKIMENDINIKKDDKDYMELLDINKKLWDIEDSIRDKERKKEFDEDFINLARSVYITNDKRSDIKKRINIKGGSNLIEEKSYEKYI